MKQSLFQNIAKATGALLFAVVTSAGLTGCYVEANPTGRISPSDKEPQAISFTASVGQTARTRAGVAVQSTAFDAGEQINIECTPNGGSMASAFYTTAAADNAGVNALTLSSGSTALVWPQSGTIDLKAFYPSSVTSSSTSFTVQTDQSTDANYKASDLMYATPISGQAHTQNAVGLDFKHALSKIIVNLTPGSYFSAQDVAACTVTLSADTEATISSGVVSASSTPGTITMGTGSGLAAIIAPQTIPASQNYITISYSTVSASFQLSSSQTLDAGKVYTYNLTVDNSSGITTITLQSTTITDWVDGGTTSGTVTL